MTQYNFTTNIEKRMPTTGEVFFIDRMTSDYAQAHPFDVDAYLESIYQKWQACETAAFRETREALRRQWDRTLGERNPRGNATLYPNRNDTKHPALMEVWHKAGDFWRRGLRLGDVLPAIVPACRITRTEDGWIALFPKDAQLLEQGRTAEPATQPATATEEVPAAPAPEETPATEPAPTTEDTPATEETPAPTLEPACEITEQPAAVPYVAIVSQPQPQQPQPQPDPRDEELADLRQQLAAMRQQMAEDQRKHDAMLTERKRQQLAREKAAAREARRQQRAEQQAREEEQQRKEKKQGVLKFIGYAAVTITACIVIYNTGLLIPLGLIGLATGGILK